MLVVPRAIVWVEMIIRALIKLINITIGLIEKALRPSSGSGFWLTPRFNLKAIYLLDYNVEMCIILVHLHAI